MTTEPQTNSPEPPALRFPLVYLFYAITVLAAALATFGVWGIVSAVAGLIFWGVVFRSKARPRMFGYFLYTVICLYFLAGCLLPFLQWSGESSRIGTCDNNLRQLALAVRAYQEEHGVLPPAVVTDSSGKPMHSWRVLILPYLEEQKLYDAYNFNEPWNGPNNSKLAASIPRLYCCPSHPSSPGQPVGTTSYFAVVGPDTAWSGLKGATTREHESANEQTLLLVESHQLNVNWLEPRDFTAAEVIALETGKNTNDRGTHRFDDLADGFETHGRLAALFNAKTTVLIEGLTDETAAGLVYRSANPTLGAGYVEHMRVLRRHELGYDFWLRFALFVLIVLFPVPWVWIHPSGPRRYGFVSFRVSSRRA